jgi:hypothetical protein
MSSFPILDPIDGSILPKMPQSPPMSQSPTIPQSPRKLPPIDISILNPIPPILSRSESPPRSERPPGSQYLVNLNPPRSESPPRSQIIVNHSEFMTRLRQVVLNTPLRSLSPPTGPPMPRSFPSNYGTTFKPSYRPGDFSGEPCANKGCQNESGSKYRCKQCYLSYRNGVRDGQKLTPHAPLVLTLKEARRFTRSHLRDSADDIVNRLFDGSSK